MSWTCINNHIAIKEETRIAHLEAADVYSALQDGGFVFQGNSYPSPEEAFPDLIFSNISYNAVVKLYSKNKGIFINVTAGDSLVDIVNGCVIDQIIDEDWHYISNAEELNILFEGMGIGNETEISITTYLELLRRDFHSGMIRNEVSSEALSVDLEYNKPTGLTADLYKYQQNGFSWMEYMLRNTHGCILGDEMGLGKTLQAIALIVERSNRGEKCLVIAPVSLLDNWFSECAKFAPGLRVLIHHGVSRTGSPAGFNGYDLVVTSYGHAVTDNILFRMVRWNLVILDEAQNIKNSTSNRSKLIKDIESDQRLAITGTPFENHVTDVWSLIDFILPGYLGTEKTFISMISDDMKGAKKLEPILTSVMVRRLVRDVAQDLPEKIIIAQPLTMHDEEADEYENIREDLKGEKISLGMLQKLRMFCTYPGIQCNNPISGDPSRNSIKYERTCEILEEIFSKGEKVIIFTSYQKMFDVFTQDIPMRFRIPINIINGSTPVHERQEIVNWFNGLYGSAVLLLNPRAAGTGLNITAANHVIHYNLEWNPAVEDQASARAYRRGQTKTTFIYRLYYKGTVEEVINERLERKRDMAEISVIGADGTEADIQDIVNAISISPGRKGLS